MKRLLLTALMLLFSIYSFSQCPPNINFEYNNLTNWKCFKGTVSTGTGACPACTPSIPTWNPTTPVSPITNRHQITTGTGLDPYFLMSPSVNCPIVCPWIPGNQHSLKLGNDDVFDSCEKVIYYFHVPSNYYTFTYWYAIILEKPTSGHTLKTMPRFQVRAYDSLTNVDVSCTNSNFIAGSSMPGFVAHKISTTTPGGYLDTAMCKNWSPAFINFKNLQGHTIAIEFFTADCTQGGHFGYAYIDFDQCSTASIKLAGCANSGYDTLVAPPGFQSYQWYDSLWQPVANGSNDTLILPSLTDTTKFYLAFFPYPGFGCPDTIPLIVSPLQKPIANFGFKDSICPGLNFIFHDSSLAVTIGQNVSNWNWNFGDPSSGSSNYSNLQNPTHLYQNLGNYNVSLVIKTNTGCFSDTIIKTIHIVNTNNVKLYKDTSICFGDTILLIANSTIPQSWNWSPTPISNSSNWAIYSPTNTIKVKVSAQSACFASDSITIKVHHVNITSKSHDTLVCPYNKVNLFVHSIGSNFTYWYNAFDPKTQIYGDTTTVTAVTNDTLFVLVSDSIGCEDSTVIKVDILPSPTSTFTLDSSICLGLCDTIHYTGNDPIHHNFHWSPSLNWINKSDTLNPIFCFNTPGIKTIKLHINDGGCQSTDSLIIDIHTGTKPSIIGRDSICIGFNDTLKIIPTGIYIWSTGQKTDTIIINQSGSFKAYLINKWGCIDSTKKTIQFFPNPIANAGRDTTILNGHSVQLDGTSSILASYFSWNIGVNTPTYPVNPQNDTWYVLSVTSNKGCVDLDSVFIRVLQCKMPIVPNAFSPNGDGLDDFYKIINPDDFDRLQLMEIYDRWGVLVWANNDKFKGWDGKYKGIDQPIGTYVYQITVICNNSTYKIKGDVTIIR